MIFIKYIFVFLILTNTVNAKNIATFKLSYVLENLNSYLEFKKILSLKKDEIFNDLKTQEENLILKKKEIEDSRILLSDEEYQRNVYLYNDQNSIFNKKVDKSNEFLNSNIEYNEKILFDEIQKIVKEISINNNFDIVLSDNQYFLSSSDIDISELIIKEMNKKNIKLKILKFEQNE